MKQHRAKKAIVYAAINITNGKRYIGITSGPLSRRITEHISCANRFTHNGSFYKAIRKYGREAFEWVVLLQCDSYVEATNAEIAFIAEFNPEYNSTKGGDGQLGRPMSEDGKRRISEANKGKQYHKMPHSEETKERLRQIGLQNKERWAQHSHLGPASSSRRVICLSDSQIFESASSAARNYGVCKSAVIELCLGRRNRKSVGGHVFKYVDQVQ